MHHVQSHLWTDAAKGASEDRLDEENGDGNVELRWRGGGRPMMRTIDDDGEVIVIVGIGKFLAKCA